MPTVAVAVAELLRDRGIKHVYTVSGGADLHLIHAITETDGIECIPMQNEQGAAFAADACARLTGIGCALATSGPGATNLLTGVAASYYDSVPVLFITGQVTTFRRAHNFGNVRQYGFQETPIVPMSETVTKYSAEPEDRGIVMAIIDAAFEAMTDCRPGPALVSIPDDIQRAEI